MPVEPCLPLAVWLYGRRFPWPLVWEVSIDWSFSVDAEKVEDFSGYTETTTISGSGSGSIIISLDPHRGNLSGGANVTPEKFIVTRRVTSNVAQARRFQLYCLETAVAGTHSITYVSDIDYDDPSETDTSSENEVAGDSTVSQFEMIIEPDIVTVTSMFVTSDSKWVAPDDWTFDRADLFLPQTQTLTRTAAEIGYDTGTGWEQSATIQLTSYADRPL